MAKRKKAAALELEEIGQPWEWVQRRLAAAEQARAFSRPSDSYIPGRPDWPEERRFQLQFHRSTHIIRAMFPGNGAGKTTVAGVEADYWLQHNHPYQETPAGRVTVVWVCLKFQQMEMLREQLEAYCLTPGWTWNEQKHCYRWPNGSRLFVISNDGEWGSIQGTPMDLAIVDEECDVKLWRELTARRRGRRKTRYVISATATKGKRWMFKYIYEPWKKAHDKLGIDEEGAMLSQKHPTRWVWPRGGVQDNPISSIEDTTWYSEEFQYFSAAEQQVRLRGGFMDLNASPVFPASQLDIMEARNKKEGRAGQIGLLVEVTDPKERKLKDLPHEFTFVAGGRYQGGEIVIFEEPTDDTYVIGADFGAGLENRDWDYCSVLRQSTRKQVAEARGRWGDVHFAHVLFALGWYYREAFLIGERQFGLPTLRRLYDEFGYTYQYMNTDEAHKAPRKSDLLGHHRHHGDLIIPRLQWAISPPEKIGDRFTGKILEPVIQIRSAEAIEEHRIYEWKPKSQTLEMADATFKDLTCGAPSGYFDDRVMGNAYAVTGWIEVPRFIKPKRTFAPGSLGAALDHAKVLEEASAAAKAKGAFRHGKR